MKIKSIFISIILLFSFVLPTYAIDEPTVLNEYSVSGRYNFIDSPDFSTFPGTIEVTFTYNNTTYYGIYISSGRLVFKTNRSSVFINAPYSTICFEENTVVSSDFYYWLSNNSTWLDESLYSPEPDVPDNSSTETIVVKEDRPFFETSLLDYTVTEGLLLLLFVTTFLNNIFKQHLKGN